MSAIKIAVGGAHSTGKSTFLKRLREALKSRDVETSAVGDLASRCPLPILRKHTVESTLWIVASGIAEEVAAGYRSRVVLVDRPVVDAWAYLMAVGSGDITLPPSPSANTLRNAIENWMPTYELVYQSSLNEAIPIEDNKGRDLDPAYRSEVAHRMDCAYKDFATGYRTLSLGNVESEIEFALNRVMIALKQAETP